MPDSIDLAQDAAENYRQDVLRGALCRHRAAVLFKDGTGVCVDCGKAIGKARLKALPGAKRCMLCQQAVESKDPGDK